MGWTHNYNMSVIHYEDGRRAVRWPGGRRDYYRLEGSELVPDEADEMGVLVAGAGNTYTLTTKGAAVYSFAPNDGNGAVCRLTKMADMNGNAINLTYDNTNRLTGITDSSSRSYSLAYDNFDMLTKLTYPGSRSIEYQYDGNACLTAAVKADGYSWKYYYDGNGTMTLMTDPEGSEFVKTYYDDQDPMRVTKQSMGGSDLYQFGYDVTNGVVTYTEYAGTHKYHYGVEGKITKHIDPNNWTWEYYYDWSQLTKATDASRSRSFQYQYDEFDNVTRTTYPDGTSESTLYLTTQDGVSRLTSYTDCNGNAWSLSYDGQCNLTRATNPLNQGLSYSYDGYGQLTLITDDKGNTVKCVYDTYGNRITLYDGYDKYTKLEYDTWGASTKVTDPLGNAYSFTFDQGNRLTKAEDPSSKAFTFSYEGNGNLTNFTDANSTSVSLAYDFWDKVTSHTDGNGSTVQMHYDQAGNMLTLTNARSKETSYQYDLSFRCTKRTDPLGRSKVYAYDQTGLLTRYTDSNGSSIDYTYDIVDRLTKKSYPGGSSVTYVYDAGDRLTSRTDLAGTYTYVYDAADRLTSLSGPGSKTISYVFDVAGNLTRVRDPESSNTDYVYDKNDRLTKLTKGMSNATFTYDDAGHLASITYPNSVAGSFSYDCNGRLTKGDYSTGGTPFYTVEYWVDAVGNRTKKTQTDSGGSVTEEYLYDSAYRLTKTTVGAVVRSYAYDANGNRLTLQQGSDTTTYDYSDADELTRRIAPGPTTYSYLYDANGNLTKESSGGSDTAYAYDWENRLTQVTFPDSGNPTCAFEYNDDNLRTRMKSKSGTYTRYVWSGGDVSGRYDNSWNLQAGYLGVAGQLGFYDGNYHCYHQDGLGSVMRLTDVNGSVTDAYDYEEFGTPSHLSGSSTQEYQYTGQQYDGETSLLYLRNRYYSPALGRFITRDTSGEHSGISSLINLYAYCKSDPINRIDPKGNDSVKTEMTKALLSGNLEGAIQCATEGGAGGETANLLRELNIYLEGARLGHKNCQIVADLIRQIYQLEGLQVEIIFMQNRGVGNIWHIGSATGASVGERHYAARVIGQGFDRVYDAFVGGQGVPIADYARQFRCINPVTYLPNDIPIVTGMK